MIKAVTFTEYLKTQKENPNASEKEIFNLAWKNSSEGVKHRKFKNNIMKVVLLTGAVCASVPFFFAVTDTYTCFGANTIKAMGGKNLFLANNFKDLLDTNSLYVAFAKPNNSVDLFKNIIEDTVNIREIFDSINAFKNVSVNDLVSLIKIS